MYCYTMMLFESLIKDESSYNLLLFKSNSLNLIERSTDMCRISNHCWLVLNCKVVGALLSLTNLAI